MVTRTRCFLFAFNQRKVSYSGILHSPAQVTIGGQIAQVTFSGLVAPGLYQLNVIVPNIDPKYRFFGVPVVTFIDGVDSGSRIPWLLINFARGLGSTIQANAVQQVLEPRVGAQRVKGRPHEDPRAKTFLKRFFKPGHCLILLVQPNVDQSNLRSI